MIVLCGKTCSGKNYIRDELDRMGIDSVVTYTTRPMRKGEENGVTYNFLSKSDFERKIKEGYFTESTSYNVATGDSWLYGSHFGPEDDKKVIILNPFGLKALLDQKPQGIHPLIVYLKAPEELLHSRLIERGDNPFEANRRLSADRADFADIETYAQLIVNNDGSRSSMDIASQIISAHSEILKEHAPREKSKVQIERPDYIFKTR